MKKLLFLFFILVLSFKVFSQNDEYERRVHDPEARKVLDKLSKKMAKDTTVRVYFEYNYYNAADSSENSFKGYLFVKGDKFKLIVPNVETFCDGKKVYSFNKKSNEMDITFYDTASSEILTPRGVLDVYKSGFKYRLRGIATFDAKVKKNGKITTEKTEAYVVDLYPEHPKGVPYSIIRIWIDKNKNQLVSIMYQGKNGVQQVVNILEYKSNPLINDKMFEFDKSRYPSDMEIVDFTEK